ncbi:ParB/RepB/Spo0J family partition protein [Tepidibacter formicigenes]|jgi:ParB family chromosome partitioning protein|uniref:Chromosome partitioning protein, ParB family n=1 Tax=Tepidibacter formicigenes DSM 15518 TaxID=1123349 RepID=A0A1M6LU72_9FIRM|nr:ParB/RepB/Spo0J family partition protein [Tepidibacter formicigenes]SHJ74807.1 chromosome partitioning protein, ParB family [Tepidibacter formicigenes DSM 15518]
MAKFNLNSLLSGTSLNGAAGKEGGRKSKTLKVVSISVFDLEPSKENFYSVEDIEELKDSIEMFGIKQNLTVKQLDNGKYKVIAGHRRRLASLALVKEGKKEFEFIPCAIETELDEIKEQLLLITTNATARQLTDWEKTQQAERLKELLERYKKKEKLPGRVRELVAKTLKTSAAQVGRMDSISKKLSEDFKEEFKEQKINISTAYEISTLPKEAQQEVFKKYMEKGNISINDVKEKKAEIKTIAEENKENAEQEEDQKEAAEETIQEEEKKIKTEGEGKKAEVKKEIPEPQPFPTIFEIIKGMNISEMVEFICCRCDGVGRFCDYAFECNQSDIEERHGICMKWLKTQAQKRG